VGPPRHISSPFFLSSSALSCGPAHHAPSSLRESHQPPTLIEPDPDCTLHESPLTGTSGHTTFVTFRASTVVSERGRAYRVWTSCSSVSNRWPHPAWAGSSCTE